MTLHRTPLHHQAFGLIRDGRITWCEAGDAPKDPDGVPRKPAGFVHRNGERLAPALLVALWEMRQAALIDVADGRLVITAVGRERLSEWDATKVRRHA